MTATHAEVLRSLPPELGALRGGEEGRAWELELGPEGTQRIGTLSLPMTELVIRLRGYSPEEGAAFIERLERYCRRGGG